MPRHSWATQYAASQFRKTTSSGGGMNSQRKSKPGRDKGGRRGGGRGGRGGRDRDRGGGSRTGPAASVNSALSDGGDKLAPFCKPTKRRLVNVPLEFSNLKEWCATIAHNLLAEYWSVYSSGNRVRMNATCTGEGTLAIAGAAADDGALAQNAFVIGGRVHIVTEQKKLPSGDVIVRVKPAVSGGGHVSIASIGYVGSYISEYAALVELASQGKVSPLTRCVLAPRNDAPGDYVSRPLRSEISINHSQLQAVKGLKHCLEKIQGPPGTGKSTTIFHIITSRLPEDCRVLVTCSRNVAVESLAQKLEQCTSDRMLVIGQEKNVGEVARKYLMAAKCSRDPTVEKIGRMARVYANCEERLTSALRVSVRRGPSRPLWARVWTAFINHKYRRQRLLAEYCGRVSMYADVMMLAEMDACKARMIDRTRIFLCTIASTGRLLREWEEAGMDPLKVHSVIVDECGCTPESSVGLLLRLNPKNLILVGDHKQLPPCSLVPPDQLIGTGHARSLLERCVLASGTVHKLREQYRMDSRICEVVSGLFYNNLITTPACVNQSRKGIVEREALKWWGSNGTEEVASTGKSYVNYVEVEASARLAMQLRAKYPNKSIAIIVMYKGQLLEVMKALPHSQNIDVLTVDSCQGSEFDHVVLSLVRSNRRGIIGFVKDRQRVCVAISRSKLSLHIVGNMSTLWTNPDWRTVGARCRMDDVRGLTSAPALPLVGSFVSVYDEKLKLAKTKAMSGDVEAAAALPAPDLMALGSTSLLSGQRPSGRGGRGDHGDRRASRGGGGRSMGGGGGRGSRGRGRGGGRSGGRSFRGEYEGFEDSYVAPPPPSLTSSDFPSLPEASLRQIPTRLNEAVVSWANTGTDAGHESMSVDDLVDIFNDRVLVTEVYGRFRENSTPAAAAQRAFLVLLEMQDTGDTSGAGEDWEYDDLEWDRPAAVYSDVEYSSESDGQGEYYGFSSKESDDDDDDDDDLMEGFIFGDDTISGASNSSQTSSAPPPVQGPAVRQAWTSSASTPRTAAVNSRTLPADPGRPSQDDGLVATPAPGAVDEAMVLQLEDMGFPLDQILKVLPSCRDATHAAEVLLGASFEAASEVPAPVSQPLPSSNTASLPAGRGMGRGRGSASVGSSGPVAQGNSWLYSGTSIGDHPTSGGRGRGRGRGRSGEAIAPLQPKAASADKGGMEGTLEGAVAAFLESAGMNDPDLRNYMVQSITIMQEDDDVDIDEMTSDLDAVLRGHGVEGASCADFFTAFGFLRRR